MHLRKINQVQNHRSPRVFPFPPAASRGRGRGAWGGALLIALLSGPATARAESTTVAPTTHGGATSFGLAGTTRADPDNLDNVWHGSAVLALDPSYDIVADGFIDPGTWRGVKAAALDSRTGAFTLGLQYSFARIDDLPMTEDDLPGWKLPDASAENTAAAQHLAAGAAYAVGEERRLAIGVHGGWFWRRTAIAGDGSGLRLGGSVAGRPSDTLTLSLAGTAPLLVDGARDGEGLPWLEAGTRWQVAEPVVLMADAALPLRDVDGFDFSVAAQGTIGELVPLRVGYSRCAGDVRHALGAGIGIVSEALNLQYGVWFDLGPSTVGDGLVAPRHALSIAMQL